MKSWFSAFLTRSTAGALPARRVKAPFTGAFRARSLLCAARGSSLLAMALLVGSHTAVQGSEQPELRRFGTPGARQTQMEISSPLAMQHPTTEMSQSGGVTGQRSASRVVFVDSGVAESQVIVAAAAPEVAVVVLDAHTDGIKQIADHVRDLRDLESISIVSHGNPGALSLGNSTLHRAGLAGYQEELTRIGAALKPHGELLLYGCSVGRGAMGQAFLNDLAKATGAVLGASNNVTGSAAQGGDWNLEVSTAALSTAPALDVGKLASYGHVLAQPTRSGATAYIGEQFLTLFFDIALDASHPPATDAFSVQVSGLGVMVSAVEVNSTDKSVKITFTGAPLVPGDVMDFTYQDPTDGNDVNAIQGLDGTDAATFSDTILIQDSRPGPSAPSVATLDSGSDSGTSGDSITNDNTPTVSGTAEAGATVKLYDTDGTTLLGTTTADGSGHWSVTSSGLSDGSHTLRTTQTNASSQTSALSTGLAVTIDTVGPVGMALSTTNVAVANATNGASLATLSSTDITSVAYAFAVGNGTTDADNGRFSITGTSLIAAQNLSAGSYRIYLKATDAAGNDSFQSFTFTVVAAPTITSVAVPAAASYGAGDSLDFTVHYDSAVTVTGTPRLAITVGGTTRYATYVVGSSTATALVFRYVPKWGDLDADGIAAGAALELNGGTINSTVGAVPAELELNGIADTTGLRVDAGPLPTLEAYLKSSNTASNQSFGIAVAVSGDTAVVGACGETGNSGAAYVFTRSGTTWTQQARLTAGNAEAGDYFGGSVAISGDTVVVGAYAEDSNATGVNGNQADNSASGAGAAYVFTRSGTTWTQQAYLKASNAGAGDDFGVTVAISGDTVVVGADNEAGSATGVNGNQADNSASGAGAAYVFTRSGTTWTQQAYLKASNAGMGDKFGSSVAVSGDTVVVGAIREDSNATGVNGNQTNNTTDSAGAAYVFARSGTTWSQQAYLKAGNTGANDTFGNAVAISGDTLVVGARYEASSATGVNGDGANDNAASAGAAYVFTRSGTTWTQQAYLKASNTNGSDLFGQSVGISDGTIVVGAYLEDSNATGVNGDQTNNTTNAAGAAYVFARNGSTWSQQAYLKAGNTGVGDSFGYAVAVAGGAVIVGARSEASNATGVNGNGADNSALDAGAAYAFAIPSTAVTSVTVPPAATYGNGQTLSFTVNYSGAVTVTGTPRLALTIGSTTKYATYYSGSGTTALLFRYTVQSALADPDGIAVSPSIDLNGGTLRDGTGDDVNLLFSAATAGVLIDAIAPTVTDAHISISGASGAGGAFRIGDTVTATWDNTATGDNNTDVSGVTVNFSLFGGGSTVVASNNAQTWTATYTIVAGAIDATNRNVSVTAIDNAGNPTIRIDTANVTVDSAAPTVTPASISLAGASGTGGAFKIGDTVTATWNNTGAGDNNADTISGVTVDFSPFGGGAAVAASNSGGIWTATYALGAGAIDAINRKVSVTATDNAGNAITTVDDTNATVDNLAPTVTDAQIFLSGATGAGGVFKTGDTVTATWDNTAGGDNNADTISGVTVDFSAFGGGTAVAASNSSGTWTATHTIAAGAIEATNLNVSVTATDNAGNATTIADSTNATVDNAAPTAPSTPDLEAASDTGSSATDNITKATTPTFTGTAEAGRTVKLYSGATLLGSTTATGGNWSITSSSLAGGPHSIKATATDTMGNVSAASAGLAVAIDTTAPAVSTIARQTPATLNTDAATVTWRVTFTEPVTGVDPTDFAITLLDGIATGTIVSATGVPGSETTDYAVTVNVSGQGALRLDKVSGTGIVDLAGNTIDANEVTTGQMYIVGVANVFDTISLTNGGSVTATAAGASKLAQRFTTGATEPLTLTTVAAALGWTYDEPGAPVPVVTIHADNGGVPAAAELAILDHPGALEPHALNVWTGNLRLTASTTYWVVFATTPASTGRFEINTTAATSGGQGTWLASAAAADYKYRYGTNQAVGALRIAIGATSTPVITSSLAASGTSGTAFSYQITATNTPTSFAATGLPTGLSLNATTGVISGTPTQAGTFNVTLTGANAGRPGPASILVLTIAPEPPPSKQSQTIAFTPLGHAVVGDVVSLSASASSGLPVSFTLVSGPATLSGSTVTCTGIGVVTVRATQPGNGSYNAATPVGQSFTVGLPTPTVTTPTQVPAPEPGGTATLTVPTPVPSATYQWQRNGEDLANATHPTLTLPDVQPPAAGLYTYTASTAGGTAAVSEPVIVGVATEDKVTGTGELVGADIRHPNGNVYDQLILEGHGATFTAEPTQVTRMSYVDLSGDIVQVEFSGAGSLSLVMDDAGTPAPAANYNQPGVNYVRGNPGIVITGADETTNVSVISVGRINAVNQSLFRDDVAYDGVANIAFIAIQSTNGQFGGVRTGNVEYFAAQGFTGVYAPGVTFNGPVNIGDIQAHDDAQPLLVVGSAANVRIAGGSLAQPNGQPIKVDGLTQVTMAPGQTSQGGALPAQANQGILQQDGIDVTDLIVMKP